MNRTTKVILIATLAVAAILSVAFALPAGRKGRPGKGPDLEKLADNLELSEDQIDRIREIRYDFEEDGIDRRAELEKAQLEMRKLMDEDDFDRGKIMAQAEKVTTLESEMKLAKIDGMLRALEVLTDKQREELGELRKERARQMGKDRDMERMNRGGFPGPGGSPGMPPEGD